MRWVLTGCWSINLNVNSRPLLAISKGSMFVETWSWCSSTYKLIHIVLRQHMRVWRVHSDTHCGIWLKRSHTAGWPLVTWTVNFKLWESCKQGGRVEGKHLRQHWPSSAIKWENTDVPTSYDLHLWMFWADSSLCHQFSNGSIEAAFCSHLNSTSVLHCHPGMPCMQYCMSNASARLSGTTYVITLLQILWSGLFTWLISRDWFY